MRFVGAATLVALLAGCSAPQPRDAAWAQRKIDEAQCRAWAQSQARAEYGPQLRQAARQTFGAVRAHLATVLIAAATLAAGVVLACIGLHVLSD